MMNDFVKTNGMFSEALGWSDNVNKADEHTSIHKEMLYKGLSEELHLE